MSERDPRVTMREIIGLLRHALSCSDTSDCEFCDQARTICDSMKNLPCIGEVFERKTPKAKIPGEYWIESRYVIDITSTQVIFTNENGLKRKVPISKWLEWAANATVVRRVDDE